MTTFTEGRHAGEAILSEGNGDISRAALTIGASQTILACGLLGRTAVAAGVAVSQVFAGTGNGVLTIADPAVSSRVKDGDYTVVCVGEDADGGQFRVEDPNGKHIGDAVVGVAFNKEIKFTIADGATDFVLGDTFTITVAADAADFEHVAFDPTANDGSEVPVAMSIYPVTTGVGETKPVASIVRLATLNDAQIEWPDGITAAQKADAIQALEDRNIILR